MEKINMYLDITEGILAGVVQYDDEQEEQQQQQEEQLIPELAPIPDEVYDNDYEVLG